MGAMDVYLKKLEDYSDLDAEMIKRAKINKVLKMIGKLRTIPEDEKYNFRERAVALFEKCNKLLSDAGEGAEKPSAEPEKKDEKEVNGSEEASAEKEEAEEKKEETEDKMEEDTEEKKGEEEAADKAEEKTTKDVVVSDEKKDDEDVEMKEADTAEAGEDKKDA